MACIDMVNNAGRSALHGAADGGHLEIVNLLIEHGAFVNPLDHEQKTPLDHAIAGGHAAIITRLAGVGAETGAVRLAHHKPPRDT